MDERQLKNLLNGDVPPADDNARKRALNLALAEFQAVKKEPQKTFQGFGGLARLTGRGNPNPRRERMNKKLIYGGMATAMVVVLAASASVYQFNRNPVRESAAPSPIAHPAVQMLAMNQIAPAPALKKEIVIQENSKAVPRNVAPVEASSLAADIAVNKPVAVASTPAAPTAKITMLMGESRIVGGAVAPGAAGMATPMEMDVIAPAAYHDVGRDKFEKFDESPVKAVKDAPVSTFSVDVDTASYSFIRKQLNNGVLPQKDAVRVEEMVNYFDYHYALPQDKSEPFKPSVTVVPSPWVDGHKLVHIGIKGYNIAQAQKPRSNLVFLIDTSGSMNEPDKLPLLKNSLKLLLDELQPDDTVGIVTYAGAAGIALEPTKVSDKAKIIAVIDSLGAGGGTAGAEGIRTAYQLAESIKNEEKPKLSPIDDHGPVREDGQQAEPAPTSVTRIILATDGDFNIGITDPNELKGFIERERDSGIFLSVLGFGTGNYNDQMMQDLAQNGNGVAAYIDTLNEARKVLVEEAASTLFTIAKDVKLQVEFNPATVAEYRLVGYETRALAKEDFNNDKVDAGDIGSGHAVTAIYDITPVGALKSFDDSRYSKGETKLIEPVGMMNSEYGFLKIRYKLPDGDTSKLITVPIAADKDVPLASQCAPVVRCVPASDDVQFSVAVAGFGQLLKGSKYTGKLTYDDVINEAQAAKGADEFGQRAEFINLVRLAKSAQGLPGAGQ